MGPATILLVYVLGKLENSFPNFSTFHSPLLENKKKYLTSLGEIPVPRLQRLPPPLRYFPICGWLKSDSKQKG